MKNIYSIFSLFLLLISVTVVGQTKIYAPNLIAPENLETNQMPDAVLDWDAVTGITLDITYEVQLANNLDFTGAITFDRTDVTAMSMSNLLFGGTYYWRVKAFDGDDASGWSETWSFSVVWTVVLDKPDDADDEIYSNPIITWDQLTGISSYQLQLDTVYSWNVQESGVTSNINATYVIGDNDIWAVGASGLAIHNDGTGWTNVVTGVTENLNDVFFIDETNGYAVGDGGTVLFYDGTSWTIVEVGVETDLLGVSFANTDNGVVVGDTGVVVIHNSGIWEYVETGDINNLFDVDMINPTSIWACGEGKIVVTYNGTDWDANIVGTKDHYAIDMIDENNGWTVGKSGKIVGWDGNTWTEADYGTSKDLNAISLDGNTGVVVGSSGTMLSFNGTWTKSTAVVSSDLEGVSILGSTAYAVGEDGVVLTHAAGGFESPFLSTFNISSDSSSLALHELFFGQTYYYRIKAMHASDTSIWSGAKSFTTYAAPVLLTPANSSTTDLLVKFTWEEYKGTTNYIFEIDDDENFTQPRSFSPDDDTLLVNDLVFGNEYFWRVAAQHAVDISEWSDVNSFNTVNEITLIAPANDAIEAALCPAYLWDEVVGASKYELWIDIDAAFSNPMITITDDPYFQCQSQLVKNTMYYWKVRGQAGADFSEWSPNWSFTTEGASGIDDQLDVASIKVYPNPSNGEFVLDINSFIDEDYNLSVIDITGKLVYSSKIECKVGTNNIPVNIKNLKSGVYSLMVGNESQVVTRRLLIK
jgi:hypothetical protein